MWGYFFELEMRKLKYEYFFNNSIIILLILFTLFVIRFFKQSIKVIEAKGSHFYPRKEHRQV